METSKFLAISFAGTPLPIKILMGWDRPLQGYFLVIQFLDRDDNYLWSNLDHEDSHPKALDRFLQVLKDFGLEIPPPMIQEIKSDALNNVGNKTVTYSVDSEY